jgi:hypothetical protein
MPIQLLVRPSFRPRWAALRNFSEGGVAIALYFPLEVDTAVAMRIRNRLEDRTFIKLAQVRHVTALDNGSRLLGCRFAEPLSAEEIAVLIDDEVCRASAEESVGVRLT